MSAKSAILLAAGRGERLKPLTDKIPKPLITVQGIALIDYHLERLAKAGFERVYINHAYKGGLIRQHVGNGKKYGLEIIFLPEPPGALETGGALFELNNTMSSSLCLAINADIYTEYPFTTEPPKNFRKIHLVLVKPTPDAQKGDFGLTREGFVTNTPPTFLYSGIAWYSKAALNNLVPGRYSITPFLRHLADEGHVTGEIFEGLWCDVGTPERLTTLKKELRLKTD